jgi:hypothetical protein
MLLGTHPVAAVARGAIAFPIGLDDPPGSNRELLSNRPALEKLFGRSAARC